MPTERGSVALCDMVDEHGLVLVNALELVERITGDGLVTPDEYRLLRDVKVQLIKSYAPLPGRVAQQDDAFRCIGAIAGAGRVSRHAASKVRQAHADLVEAA